MKTTKDMSPDMIKATEDSLKILVQSFIKKPSYDTASSVFNAFKALCNHHGMSMLQVEVAAVSNHEHKKKTEIK